MTEEERRKYAEHVLLDHVEDIEFLSIHEMYAAYKGDDDAELSDEEASAVLDLINEATVTVSWPDADTTDPVEELAELKCALRLHFTHHDPAVRRSAEEYLRHEMGTAEVTS